MKLLISYWLVASFFTAFGWCLRHLLSGASSSTRTIREGNPRYWE